VSASRELTTAGRVTCLALAGCVVALLAFDHPWPRWVAAFLLALLGLSFLGVGARIPRCERLAPARMDEGSNRELELSVRHQGRAPLFAGRVYANAGEFHVPKQAFSVSPGSHRLPLRVRAHVRGRATTFRLHAESWQPFGLVRHRATLQLACDTWVFPTPRVLRESVLEEMLEMQPCGLDLPQPTGPGEAEFHSLREWREGDSEHHVHPRVSARRGRKVLRVFRGEAPPHLQLVLDLRVQDGPTFERADFEEAVRVVAGITRSMLRRSVPVRLWFHGERRLRAVVPERCRDLHGYLAALALARPIPVEASELDPAVLPTQRAGSRGVLLHLGDAGAADDPAWVRLRVGSTDFWRLVQPWHGQLVGSES